jgi:uncharacterized membrane protein
MDTFEDRSMSAYLLVKWVHVLSSVVLVGTGFGSAYYMFFANRSANAEARAVVARLVVRADWWFTTPAGILQPATGLVLTHMLGLSLLTPWIVAALALYLIAGACWIPVVWLQIQMASMASEAARHQLALPDRYATYAHRWEYLGYPAFIAMLAVFYLMVAKPGF